MDRVAIFWMVVVLYAYEDQVVRTIPFSPLLTLFAIVQTWYGREYWGPVKRSSVWSR